MSKKYIIKKTEYTSESYSYTNSEAETRRYLIEFYTRQYNTFIDIGIGGQTRFGVKVTEKLIQCTANRLNQLQTGEKTASNTCYPENIISILGRHIGNVPIGRRQLMNSNRSFMGNAPSRFYTADLGDDNRLSIQYHAQTFFCSDMHRRSVEYTPYIDKISTAYNSEIMQAVLSHDN